MQATQKDLVLRLIRFDSHLNETLSALREYPWDCNQPLATLEAASLRSVLQRYLSRIFTSADVAEWANAIECREDIDYSSFRDIVFELADPDITRQLEPHSAEQLLNRIDRCVT